MAIAREGSGSKFWSARAYEDAFRQGLPDAGVAVERVSGKAVHDYAEILDGVPSQHDGKDPAIVAELALWGSRPLGHTAPSPFNTAKKFGHAPVSRSLPRSFERGIVASLGQRGWSRLMLAAFQLAERGGEHHA